MKKPMSMTRDMGEENDEPLAVDDAFPREGSMKDQQMWRRREENRKRPGTRILPPMSERGDPLYGALMPKPKPKGNVK